MDQPQSSKICRCLRPTCRFHFPASPHQALPAHCPKCGSPLAITELPYSGLPVPAQAASPQPQVSVLLDNLRSAHNVGSIFRTADAAGITHLYLCGITPTPGQPKVAKTALGAELRVPWSQTWNAVDLVTEEKARGAQIWALEGGPNAQPLFTQTLATAAAPVILILGNEVSGVDPSLLALCHQVVYLPMMGQKESLNVSVAFGIAAYYLRFLAGD